ncbi:MAG: hypothetical protein NBV77_00500 [Bacteroidia bacterium]|nr:hypothetical protein [Bacteroidia bacterium]
MNINITETDLISYFYNESSPEVTDYIQVNISNRLDWQEFIHELQLLRSSMTNFQNPHPTSLNIVLEEVSLEANHSL